MTDKEIIEIDGVDVSGCRYYKESLNFEYMRINSCKGYGFCIHNLPSREFVTSPRYDIPRCYGQKFCNYKQLARKTAECEELKKANIHIDNNRKCKAKKLKEIEQLLIDYSSGYTDEVMQKIMEIIHKPKTVCFENKYEQALDTVSEYIKDNCNSCQGIKYGGCEKCELKRISDIISKAKDGE